MAKKNPLEKYTINELLKEAAERSGGLVATWLDDEGDMNATVKGDLVTQHALVSMLRLTVDRKTDGGGE